MFRKIMFPVDLEHAEALEDALSEAVAIARRDGAEICFVSVGDGAPGVIAPTASGFADALERFAQEQAEKHGVKTASKSVEVHDLVAQLTETLVALVEEIGADLVVMATHRPGFADFFFANHGASVASRVGTSVFLVR